MMLILHELIMLAYAWLLIVIAFILCTIIFGIVTFQALWVISMITEAKELKRKSATDWLYTTIEKEALTAQRRGMLVQVQTAFGKWVEAAPLQLMDGRNMRIKQPTYGLIRIKTHKRKRYYGLLPTRRNS